MKSVTRLRFTHRLRPLLLGAILVLIIMQIVALSPSSVEDSSSSGDPVEPETLVPQNKKFLATGIPAHRVPEYSVDQFTYLSTTGTKKEWSIVSDHAYMYNQEKLVHSIVVTAYLYDPDGKQTVVTGKEAKYFMDKRDLEIFGDVKTVFPDGFEVHSEYMRYRPNERIVDIPQQYDVHGKGTDEKGQELSFDSRGLHYAMSTGEIILPADVKMVVDKQNKDPKAVSSRTVVESDRAQIDREKKITHFTMEASRPAAQRFVLVRQPMLFARGRRADLNYGDFDKLINYMTLHEDTYIEERNAKGVALRYSTAGRSDFDAIRDLVILREFPQVYQDSDTVTGDIILLHRDTDIVEIEHSNAYSQGQ